MIGAAVASVHTFVAVDGIQYRVPATGLHKNQILILCKPNGTPKVCVRVTSIGEGVLPALVVGKLTSQEAAHVLGHPNVYVQGVQAS